MSEIGDKTLAGSWPFGATEKRQLAVKFKVSLLQCLRDYEQYSITTTPSLEDLISLANRFEEACRILDECSGNCETLAATFRNYAGISPHAEPRAAEAARFARSSGKEVILTRTTIEELKGADVSLAQIEGGNAIVCHGDDYWGTPVDRLIILADEEEQALVDEDETPSVPDEVAFFLRLKEDELGNALQFMALTGRVGQMEFRSPDGEKAGSVFVEHGRIVHAECDGHEAVKALATLFNKGALEGCFTDGAIPAKKTITLKTDQLLIEAAVMADEVRSGRST
ncbi:MAG: DUF4388 domain-containing protein [Lentisphaeria bacterium]|nr:DUF4388 domain-containing protein [Lentisphaeria bacterium]